MFSSTFKGKVNFQGLFKTVLYIEVFFKPVQTLTCEMRESKQILQFTVFYLEGAGPLAPFFIKWPLGKARVGHLLHYVNGVILGRVLFTSEIK